MNPSQSATPAAPALRLRTGYIVVAVLLALCCLSIIGVTGFFRLGSEAALLRDSTLNSVPGGWHKKFAINVGGFTTSLARSMLSFVKLDDDARLAAGALRGAEVGIYQLSSELGTADRAALVVQADQRMADHGWSKVVGVSQKNELVAVYVPSRLSKLSRFKCAVLVLNGRDLIVGSVRGDLDPFARLAEKHLSDGNPLAHLAMR